MESFRNLSTDYTDTLAKIAGLETAYIKSKDSSIQKPASKNFKILLVDDDLEDKLLITELIEESFEANFNFTIDEASNYADAMAKLAHAKYDIAILDYKLGYKSGLDLLKRMNELNLDIPIIFITGQGDEHTAVEAIKGGAVDYLVKDDLNVDLITKTFSKFLYVNKSTLTTSMKKFISDYKKQDIAEKDSVDFKLFMNLDKVLSYKPKQLFMKARAMTKQGIDYSFFMHLDKLLKVV